MITARSNATWLRLMAGFGLVVALSAAVGLHVHPIQIGSPVAPAEPATVTSVTAPPLLDVSAQARDDWMLRPAAANRHAVDRHEDIAPQPVLTAPDVSAQASDDSMLTPAAANRHAVDRHEDIAPQPVLTAPDVSAQARDDSMLTPAAANRHAVDRHEDVGQL